jgi:hypothetical protein
MISSVSAFVRGSSANGSPTGQRSTSAAVRSRIVCTRRRTASPWNAGSMSLRARRCSSSSSSRTERGPMTGSRIALPSPAWKRSVGDVKICLTSLASATKTTAPAGSTRR